DPEVRDRRAAVGGRREPCESDLGIAGGGVQLPRGTRDRLAGRWRAGRFIRPRTFPDRVDGGDLVVVRLPIRDSGIRVRKDVGKGGQEGELPGDRPPIDLVVRDRGPAVGRGRRPREGDRRIPRDGTQILRRAGDGRGGDGSRRCLARTGTFSRVVQGGDFIIVRHAVRNGGVRIRRRNPQGREERFAARDVAPVNAVVRDR